MLMAPNLICRRLISNLGAGVNKSAPTPLIRSRSLNRRGSNRWAVATQWAAGIPTMKTAFCFTLQSKENYLALPCTPLGNGF
ncbi:hypothetical protein CEXT_51751 [Caerostris extrusa]|uniref:Uncharacterized protein n=1 Tax=Caerostris extrusa TaxID=172846 RepID=A0AAV4UBF1_CAEEX|nr:hypothetical protein CEXT_51751 [Caerostris extrusa]